MPKLITKNYTLPQVKAKGKKWYVWFRYYNEQTDSWQLVIRKGGANYSDLPDKERLAQLNALKKAIQFKLEHQGWNPLTNTYPLMSQEQVEISSLHNMTFCDALDFANRKKSKDWAKKTCQDFKSVIKYLKEAAAAIGILNMLITDIKRSHYKFVLDKVQEIRELSAKGYNKYRDYLSSLIGELEQYEIIEYNPIEKIKPKDAIKTFAHREPTQDQRLLIVNRIKNVNWNYYRFLSVLYGCTIRPKEITGLKIKHLHKIDQAFRMMPDNESSTKTKYEREVSIPDWVMNLLTEMNLHNYDPEWYIFSTGFVPGPTRMHSNTPTTWWRKIVKAKKKDGGLEQDVNQYSLKKLSGNDMVRLQRREGIDKLLELPRQQMGHTNSQTTEIYVTEHLEIMKELVKRKMPEL